MNTIATASQLWAQQLPHPAGERRKTFGGLVIPKGNGNPWRNPWRKVWETRIQWASFVNGKHESVSRKNHSPKR